MGWTTTHRAKGYTNDEWFTKELLTPDHEIVASSTVRNVYYAAIRTVSTGDVWALVVLTQRAPRSYHNFGWKDQDENMGPNAAEAPAKVLDALTETTSEYALEWRAECRKNLEHKAAQPKVKKGDKIVFRNTIRFANEFIDDTFTLVHHSTFRGSDNKLYRIPNWRTQRAWTLGEQV
jgi:hypothetical protein